MGKMISRQLKIGNYHFKQVKRDTIERKIHEGTFQHFYLGEIDFQDFSLKQVL